MTRCVECVGTGWRGHGMGGDTCGACNGTGRARPRCTYCLPGKYTGLPGNACENCMNTGYADAGPDDLAAKCEYCGLYASCDCYGKLV